MEHSTIIFDIYSLFVYPSLIFFLLYMIFYKQLASYKFLSILILSLVFLFFTIFQFSPKLSNNFLLSQDDFISPASGYIKKIEENNDSYNITILLSVFDNHTQYLPIDSRLTNISYKKGLFNNAFSEHSILNEQQSFDFISNTPHSFNYSITQITGFFTRRLLSFIKIDNILLKKGDKIGFILFGSRVDIKIPKNITTIFQLEKLTGKYVTAGTPLFKIVGKKK